MRLLSGCIMSKTISKSVNFLINIFLILLIIFIAYYYRADFSLAWRNLFNKFQPCQRPLTYSIANIDANFSLSREELLQDVAKAEKIWEDSTQKQLFKYSDNGYIKINLIYDSRQKATDDLKKLGLVINNDRTTFDTLKKQYNSFMASYDQQKAQLDSLLASYETAKNQYDQDVKYSNSHGGASKEKFNELEQRRLYLNAQVDLINQKRDTLNELADSINSTVTVLNKLIGTLNLKINDYNTIGASNGRQFNEGEYSSNGLMANINIYQFNNQEELVGVLAHELGHALGMEHVDDPKAIMYYLNEGGSEKLTTDDLKELNRVCQLK